MTDVEVFENYESEVRSYCRSFPAVFTTSKGSIMKDENGKEYDSDLMIGLWQDSTVYYRYNDDFTGVTWDVADDVYENEGVSFTWEISGSLIIHFYKMEIGGVVPKMHTISVLDLQHLSYHDEYGVEYDFVKIE